MAEILELKALEMPQETQALEHLRSLLGFTLFKNNVLRLPTVEELRQIMIEPKYVGERGGLRESKLLFSFNMLGQNNEGLVGLIHDGLGVATVTGHERDRLVYLDTHPIIGNGDFNYIGNGIIGYCQGTYSRLGCYGPREFGNFRMMPNDGTHKGDMLLMYQNALRMFRRTTGNMRYYEKLHSKR